MGKGDSNKQCDDITRPEQRMRGHRELINKQGNKMRYDPERVSPNGTRDPAHWHVHNPNWKKGMGDRGYYLNRFGQPVDRHTADATLTPEELKNLLNQLGGDIC